MMVFCYARPRQARIIVAILFFIPQKIRRQIYALLTAALSSLSVISLSAVELAASDREYHSNSGNWLIKTWQAEDGMPSSIINAIAQTPDGYLWLGTPAGLVRFDGVRAIRISAEQSTNYSSKQRITTLHVDRDGRLWLGYHSGAVSSLEPDGLTYHIRGFEGASKPKPVVSIEEDEHGCRWVGRAGDCLRMPADSASAVEQSNPAKRTTGRFEFKRDLHGKLWAVSDSNLALVENDEFKSVFSITNSRLKVALAQRGGFWVAHHAQLGRYLPGGAEEPMASLMPLGGVTEITVMLEDRVGRLWLGTVGQGLFCFANGEFTKVSVNTDRVAALWEDREGNLWAGSAGGGISRIRPRIFRILNVQDGLPKNDVRAVCADTNGVYASGQHWVASRTNGQFGKLTDRSGIPVRLPNITQSLCSTPDGSLWLGTERNGAYHWRNGVLKQIELPVPSIGALLSASTGGIWIGLRGRGLARWSDGTLTNLISGQGQGRFNAASLAEDKKGQIWVGSASGALITFQDGQFTNYKPEDSQPMRTIHCLWPNADGSLWAGTDGGGLLFFDRGKFTRLTSAEGLHDNFIYALHMDDCGQAWFGSAQGLFRIARAQLEAFARGDRPDVESFAYGRGEGLVNTVFNPASNPQRQAADGKLWFATRSGAMVFDPRLVQSESTPPPVHLDSVLVNSRLIKIKAATPGIKQARMELPPDFENIDFIFTAPSFTAPERVKLLYQLEGWDANWQVGTVTRHAVYGRLPAGNYRFHVIARSHEGAWNREGAMMAFTVLPPFWQTWWFRWSTGLAGAAVLAAIIRVIFLRRLRLHMAEVEREQALSRERERIAADLHDDVGASLTRIAQLSELTRAENHDNATSPRLEQISSAARHTIEIMDEIVWTLNPRNDSLPHLIGYLGEYAAEFFSTGSIALNLDLPESLPEVKLTSEVRHHLLMAVKETLNNTLKHSAASAATLRVSIEGGQLHLVVHDNGKGFAHAATGSGSGLRNLHQRLQACGGTVQIEAAAGQGTTVSISLPFSGRHFHSDHP